jgi:hypothetical protein
MKRETDRETGSTRLDAIAAIIVITMIVTTSLAALVPAMNKARDAALRARCAAQLKEIGEAISVYVNDYDGLLPWSGGQDPNYPPPFNGSPKDPDKHPYTVYRCNHTNNDTTYQNRALACVCGVGGYGSGIGPGKPVPMRLACLYAGGYINDARVFYCPAGSISKDRRYESYTQSPYGTTWGLPHQDYNLKANPAKNDWIRVGYGYYPIDETLKPTDDVEGTWVPKYTARKFDKLSQTAPYMTDDIWGRVSLSHKTGYIETASKITVTGAGINALFKDGHVVYQKDEPVKVWGKQETFFDNVFWNTFDPPSGAPPPAAVDARYIFYNLYKLIQP